eukprot:9422184-Prorocentrum_lima.AAC.1
MLWSPIMRAYRAALAWPMDCGSDLEVLQTLQVPPPWHQLQALQIAHFGNIRKWSQPMQAAHTWGRPPWLNRLRSQMAQWSH